MYPVIRLLDVLIRGRSRAPIQPGDVSELRMICWPWDCDIFFEMNNGRHLTLFDLGRFDYGMRTGLIGILRRRKWGLVVAGSTIRYRKRLRPFDRFTMRTRLISRDERWFYFVQDLWRNGEACSSALIRAAVTKGGRVLPSQEVAEALDAPDWSPEPPAWVAGWIESDKARPWPPEE